MTDDSLLPFSLPSVERKKITAAFDGGRLSSDGGVVLLTLAERRIGIADRLAAEIVDRRDPARVVHTSFPTFCAPASWPSPVATKMPMTWIICAVIPRSSWPAVTCRTAGAISVRSRPCRVARMRRACVR
jgi:hypothetical protein